MQTLRILVLALMIFSAISCAKKKEDAAVVEEGVAQACTFYQDNGTNAYFTCLDFSGNGLTDAQVASDCAEQNSGEVSASCPVDYTTSPSDDSTGSCQFPIDSYTVVGRWYYSVVGDAPSETALCTAYSGTWTPN